MLLFNCVIQNECRLASRLFLTLFVFLFGSQHFLVCVRVRNVWLFRFEKNMLVVYGKVDQCTFVAIENVRAILFSWVILSANPDPLVQDQLFNQ